MIFLRSADLRFSGLRFLSYRPQTATTAVCATPVFLAPCQPRGRSCGRAALGLGCTLDLKEIIRPPLALDLLPEFRMAQNHHHPSPLPRGEGVPTCRDG